MSIFSHFCTHASARAVCWEQALPRKLRCLEFGLVRLYWRINQARRSIRDHSGSRVIPLTRQACAPSYRVCVGSVIDWFDPAKLNGPLLGGIAHGFHADLQLANGFDVVRHVIDRFVIRPDKHTALQLYRYDQGDWYIAAHMPARCVRHVTLNFLNTGMAHPQTIAGPDTVSGSINVTPFKVFPASELCGVASEPVVDQVIAHFFHAPLAVAFAPSFRLTW